MRKSSVYALSLALCLFSIKGQSSIEHAQILINQNKSEQAINYLKEKIQQDPRNLKLRLFLANTYFATNQFVPALKLYEQLEKQAPTATPILYNKALAYKKLGLMEQAIPAYKRLLEIDPYHKSAHTGIADAYRAVGNFIDGWREYQWRFSKDRFKILPALDLENLTGKTILIHREGEIGDNIFFIRYLELLKRKGAYIIAQIHPALVPLFSRCPFIDEITTQEDHIFEARTGDYLIWQQSLPLLFGTTLETVPVNIPYLTTDSQLDVQWHDRLKNDAAFKIGICWQANPSLHLEKNPYSKRSVDLALFNKLAQIPGVRLYSLQKISGTQQLTHLPYGMTVHDFGHELDEEHGPFMDTASIMKQLDLVVTVDTSIAHLAGALGVPVWVMLPVVTEWRWMLTRADTPWYPTMKLFRQKEKGNWENVFDVIALEIHQLKERNNTQKPKAFIRKIQNT